MRRYLILAALFVVSFVVGYFLWPVVLAYVAYRAVRFAYLRYYVRKPAKRTAPRQLTIIRE